MFPEYLSQVKNSIRRQRCLDFLESTQNDRHFLKFVISGNDTLVFQYNPETERQSMEWHTSTSPRPKKARMSQSKIKCMLIYFFDIHGIVHKEFMPQVQTINQQF